MIAVIVGRDIGLSEALVRVAVTIEDSEICAMLGGPEMTAIRADMLYQPLIPEPDLEPLDRAPKYLKKHRRPAPARMSRTVSHNVRRGRLPREFKGRKEIE